MSSYLPAIERVGDMVEALARFLRGRRTPDPPAPDELEHAPNSGSNSDSNSNSSSHTSVSSTDWVTVPQPQTPPTPAPTMTVPSFPRLRQTTPPPPPTRAKPSTHPPLYITSLPPELHVLILKRLTFADIQRLRRTSRFFNALITKPLLRDIYGSSLDAVLLSHCHICHARDPTRSTLLYADVACPSYPFCSVCISCAVKRDELYAGKRVAMGNFRSAWVCRWCGYPVLSDPAWREPLFHQRCYSWYGTVLLAYLFAGWLQLCAVVVGAALCLDNFRRVRMVQVPCIVSPSQASDFFLSVDVNCVDILDYGVLASYFDQHPQPRHGQDVPPVLCPRGLPPRPLDPAHVRHIQNCRFLPDRPQVYLRDASFLRHKPVSPAPISPL